MRRLLLFLCAALMLLAGCGKEEEPGPWIYHASLDGVSYDLEVRFSEEDSNNGTITVGEDVYRFRYLASGDLEFTYPNGNRDIYREENGVIYSSWEFDRSVMELGYLPLSYLNSAARFGSRVRHSGGKRVSVFWSLLLCGLGIWQMVSPKSVWWLATGWRFKAAEPSDLSLVLYRLGGGLLTFIGLIALFV